MASRSAWPGSGDGGQRATWRTSRKASSSRRPAGSAAWAEATVGHAEGGDRVDVASNLAGSSSVCHGADQAVEQQRLPPQVGGAVVGVGDVTGQQGRRRCRPPSRRRSWGRTGRGWSASRRSAGARRRACGRRRRSVSPGLTQRMRSSGSSIARLIRSTVNQLVTSVAFGHSVEHGGQVADVVVVVVGQEDPADVGRVDDREGGLDPLGAGQLVAGVDDHRLGAGDHHRVDGTTVPGGPATSSGITQVSGAIRYGSCSSGVGGIGMWRSCGIAHVGTAGGLRKSGGGRVRVAPRSSTTAAARVSK